jgi:hypothetical protein
VVVVVVATVVVVVDAGSATVVTGRVSAVLTLVGSFWLAQDPINPTTNINAAVGNAIWNQRGKSRKDQRPRLSSANSVYRGGVEM